MVGLSKKTRTSSGNSFINIQFLQIFDTFSGVTALMGDTLDGGQYKSSTINMIKLVRIYLSFSVQVTKHRLYC